MKSGCKLCWTISAILVLALGYGTYVFGVRGNVEASSDGRTAILVAPAERDVLLSEMRSFLETLQTITEAAAENDMATVSETASIMGMRAAQGVTPALMAKLPLEFKTLGMATHQAFDELSLAASVSDNPLEVVAEVSNLMLNCTGCHASYRIGIEDENN